MVIYPDRNSDLVISHKYENSNSNSDDRLGVCFVCTACDGSAGGAEDGCGVSGGNDRLDH